MWGGPGLRQALRMRAQVPPREAAWLRGRWGPEPVHALLAKPGSHSGTPFLKLLEDALRASGSRGSEPLRRTCHPSHA